MGNFDIMSNQSTLILTMCKFSIIPYKVRFFANFALDWYQIPSRESKPPSINQLEKIYGYAQSKHLNTQASSTRATSQRPMRQIRNDCKIHPGIKRRLIISFRSIKLRLSTVNGQPLRRCSNAGPNHWWYTTTRHWDGGSIEERRAKALGIGLVRCQDTW